MTSIVYFCTWAESQRLKELLAERPRTINEIAKALCLSFAGARKAIDKWRQQGLVQCFQRGRTYRYRLTRLGRKAWFVCCDRLCTVQYCKAIAILLDPFEGTRVSKICKLLNLRWNTAKKAVNVLTAAGIAECVDRLYYLNEAFAGSVAL